MFLFSYFFKSIHCHIYYDLFGTILFTLLSLKHIYNICMHTPFLDDFLIPSKGSLTVCTILTCNQCLTRETNIIAIILLILLPLEEENTRWTILITHICTFMFALVHTHIRCIAAAVLNIKKAYMLCLPSRDPFSTTTNTKISFGWKFMQRKFFLIVHMGYIILHGRFLCCLQDASAAAHVLVCWPI